jgi:hypothetical protein
MLQYNITRLSFKPEQKVQAGSNTSTVALRVVEGDKPSAYFNTEELRVLPTQSIYVFGTIFRIIAIISLSTINGPLFVIAKQCLLCDIGAAYLYVWRSNPYAVKATKLLFQIIQYDIHSENQIPAVLVSSHYF